MNNVQVFNYNNQTIRQTISEDGEILFCAKDIAASLGYKDARDLSRNLDEPPQNLRPLETEGGVQNAVFYTEAELYEVLIKSRNKRCKPLRRWVTHEVLPSIRKNGFYCSPHVLNNLTQNDSLPVVKALANAVISSQEDVKKMQEQHEKDSEQLDLFMSAADNLKILADKQRKILRDREAYKNSPDRKYDVSFKYSDGRKSNRRDFPRDIAIGFNKIKGEKHRGNIIETGENLLYEYYRREIKRYLHNENQLELNFTKEKHNGSM